MSVYLLNGAPLLAPGGIATSSNCCCGGACCNLTNFTCTTNVTHNACVNSGGIYLGDGSTCSEGDCTCCPMFNHYTQIHLSGQVLNCSSGTVNMPEQIWSKVASGGGCTMNPQEFAVDANCSCAFNAYNCFPFTNVNYIAIDETGGCADPFNFASNYFLRAQINCDGSVYFDGGATPIAPAPACATALILTPAGPYDLTAGAIDVTVNADSGDTSIQFRFILSLS